MPDILIRMEMPGSCAACDFYNVISGRCTRTGTKINFSELTTRSVDCPISELLPHGDLIDRDAFRAENEYYLNREFINPKYEDTLDDLLKDAPVVIPSNKEDSRTMGEFMCGQECGNPEDGSLRTRRKPNDKIRSETPVAV